MYPVLFRIGSLEIHTYGVMVAIGFMAGLALAQHRARAEGIPPQQIGDLGIWLIVSAMLGAKLFHIIFFWNDFIAGWHESGWASLRAGFVFFGGFIGASVTGILYARAKKIPIWKLGDVFAPALALGHMFGRFGCFFEGCCYGKACALPWAIHLPGHPLPVHPTQLYEAAGNFTIFVVLSRIHKRFDGQIWWLYVLFYCCLRYVVECFRGDYSTHYFGNFTIAQLTAIVLVIIAVVKIRMDSHALSR